MRVQTQPATYQETLSLQCFHRLAFGQTYQKHHIGFLAIAVLCGLVLLANTRCHTVSNLAQLASSVGGHLFLLVWVKNVEQARISVRCTLLCIRMAPGKRATLVQIASRLTQKTPQIVA